MANKLYGWTGKILRVNLSTKKVSDVPTSNYVPDLLGGAGVCARVIFDEVPAGTKAFDAANKLVFMTGPMAGTLAPAGMLTSVFCGMRTHLPLASYVQP